MKRLLWCLPLVVLLLPLQLNAQSVWTAPSRSDGITIEGYKPNFDQNLDGIVGATFPSSAWFLSGNYSVLPSLRLGAEVGLSHYGFDEDIPGFSANETAISNVLVSAEWMSPVENLSAVLGVRIPTTPSDNFGGLTGALADIERVNAFTPDTWTFTLDGDYNVPIYDRLSLHLQGGPLMMISTFDDEPELANDETTTEFGARYSAQGWYNAPRFMVGAGAIGVTNISMSDSDLDGADRTALAVGGSVIGKFGRAQPGVNFQLPVTSDYRNMVDWVVGVSLRVPF